jgi:DNA-binding transcriptional LysR family regulator
MNDWNHIRAFLAVADTGSLSEAASRLKVSQPTLGRYINALEHNIGESLFVRSRSGMALNQTGLALVDDARAMAAEADRFSLKAAGRENRISGTVRITASDVVATYLLPKILSELRDAESAIDIELVPSNNIQNLLSRDADIAIRMVRPTQNDLIARKVNELDMATWAHERYLAKHGRPETVADLFGHRIIGYDRLDMMINVMRQRGVKVVREDFAFRTDDQVAYWELLKAGAGIGFGSTYLARQTPELVQIMPQLEIESLPMWLTSHGELKTNARIRRVMDFLGEALVALDLS